MIPRDSGCGTELRRTLVCNMEITPRHHFLELTLCARLSQASLGSRDPMLFDWKRNRVC